MGTLQSENENDTKCPMEDSGCVQDESTKEKENMDMEPRNVQLLDLSDDVLLCIFRHCSPRDLKALGFTCERLGTLVLDRTLWQCVDARDQQTGRTRLEWYLTHALHKDTRKLHMTGYAREAMACVGHVNRPYNAPKPKRTEPSEDNSQGSPGSDTNKNSERTSSDGNASPPVLRRLARFHFNACQIPSLCGVSPVWQENETQAVVTAAAPEGCVQDSTCPGPQFTLSEALMARLRIVCPALTSMSVEFCNINCRDVDISNFPPTLRHLSLRGVKCYNLPLDRSFLYRIHDYLPLLESIDVSECECMEPAALLPLSKLNNLRRLILQYCTRLSEFIAYASLAAKYGFKKLEVLDLRGSPVGDTEVSGFGWLPELQELYLSPAPEPPQIVLHSHYRDDTVSTFQELDGWELEEPEYLKKYSSNINLDDLELNSRSPSPYYTIEQFDEAIGNNLNVLNALRFRQNELRNDNNEDRNDVNENRIDDNENRIGQNENGIGHNDNRIVIIDNRIGGIANNENGIGNHENGVGNNENRINNNDLRIGNNDYRIGYNDNGIANNDNRIDNIANRNLDNENSNGHHYERSDAIFDVKCGCKRKLNEEPCSSVRNENAGPSQVENEEMVEKKTDQRKVDDNDDQNENGPVCKKKNTENKVEENLDKDDTNSNSKSDYENNDDGPEKESKERNDKGKRKLSPSQNKNDRRNSKEDNPRSDNNTSKSDSDDSDDDDSDGIQFKRMRVSVNVGASTSKEASCNEESPSSQQPESEQSERKQYVMFRRNRDPIIITHNSPNDNQNEIMIEIKKLRRVRPPSNETADNEQREGPREIRNAVPFEGLVTHAEPRHQVMFVNFGQVGVYRIGSNVRRSHRIGPSFHVDSTALVSDMSVRLFGRADNEDENYINIGPNGPYIMGRDPNGRPNRSNLRVLSITGYRSITDSSLVHLATAAPNLRVIDFSETNVTENGVENFKSLRPECSVKFSTYKKKD